MIDYRILGPLEVSANGRLIEIGGPKLRALLVILLLRANESVPRDVLLHELWGDEPPIGAQHSLDVYVSRLRKSLSAVAAGPVVVTRPGAYSLLLVDDQLDARRFEDLVGQGRAALAANAPGQAAEKLRAALELWRGQALADLVNGHGPQIEATRLEELRLNATLGDKVTVLYGNDGALLPSLATARYVVSILNQLGYRASLRVLGPNTYWNVLGDSRSHVQVGFFQRYQDYPAPSDFIEPLLTCGSFVPANPGNGNMAEFCDPPIDAQAQRALAHQVGDPATAAGQWAAIDHELADQAPWVPLYNPRNLTVLSARTGNYQFHSYWNLLIDQLWVH